MIVNAECSKGLGVCLLNQEWPKIRLLVWVAVAGQDPSLIVDWNPVVYCDVSPDSSDVNPNVVKTCAGQCLLLDESFDVFVVFSKTCQAARQVFGIEESASDIIWIDVLAHSGILIHLSGSLPRSQILDLVLPLLAFEVISKGSKIGWELGISKS